MASLLQTLNDKETFTTTILVILYNQYGAEFFNWDPSTIAIQIKEDFGNTPTNNCRNKIQAGSSLITTDLYFKSLETFSIVNNTLNFNVSSTNTFMPANLDDCMWGCTETSILLGEDYSSDQYSHNVARYAGYLLDEEGIYKPPAVLKFAEYPDVAPGNDRSNLAEDPVLFTTFWKDQEDTSLYLEILIQKRLREMLVQIQQLPFKDIQTDFTKGLLEKIQENLSTYEQRPRSLS